MREDFDAGTGVSVHVDDDGDAVGGAFDGFPVGALEVEASFCLECKVCACEAFSAEEECGWSEGFLLIVLVCVECL